MWMNEYEITEAERRWRDHPLMGPATYTLASLLAAVNRSSDGWPYWKAPGRAAHRLMDMIMAHERWERSEYQRPREGEEATPARLRAAYAQLRAFRTRRAAVGGIEFRIKAAPGVPGDPEPVMVPSGPIPVTAQVDDHGRVTLLIDWPEGDIAPGTYEGGIDYVVQTATGRRLSSADLNQLAAEEGS